MQNVWTYNTRSLGMRKTSVAGTFYPDNSDELLRYFNHFTAEYDKHMRLPLCYSKAVIVPHAGHIYSGFTANVAYRVLALSGIKNFVVIGPSHRFSFEGISLCEESEYATPFGNIQSDLEVVNELKEAFGLETKIVHNEHSTEVQFPFIKHHIPNAKIVELIYGQIDTEFLSKIIDFVYQKKDWGVVISTDLSHFYDLSQAKLLDNICINAVKNLDLSQLHKGCEACGALGVEAMIKSAKKLNLSATILDYRTSADASGDKSRVVGYLSACFA